MQPSVLSVEDKLLIALDRKLTLEDTGRSVIGPAATVQASFDLLRLEVPMVALSDMHLGKDLVTPVACAMKAPEIPFVVSKADNNPVTSGEDIFSRIIDVASRVAAAAWRALDDALIA